VVGCVSEEEVRAFTRNLNEAFLKIERTQSAPHHIEVPPLIADRWVEQPLGREQTHILIGSRGLSLNHSDRHKLRLVETLLSGQGGRLFVELREKKSLAYSVAPMVFEGLDTGYAATYIACQPSKREEATKGVQQVLEKLASKGPSPKEMERAKEFYMGRRAMDLQSDSSQSLHYALRLFYGVALQEDRELQKRLKSITPNHIKKITDEILVRSPKVTAVV